MNENVRTIIPSYKAISLHIVKPFHFANHLALLLEDRPGLAGEDTNCRNGPGSNRLTHGPTQVRWISEESELDISIADCPMSLPLSKY